MYVPFKYFLIPSLTLNLPIYSSFYLRLDISFSPNFNHDFPLLSSLNWNFIFSLLSCVFEEASFSWYFFFCLLWTLFFSSGNEGDFCFCTFSFELNFLLVNWSIVCCPHFILPPLYRANWLSDVGARHFINGGNSFEVILELQKWLCSFSRSLRKP